MTTKVFINLKVNILIQNNYNNIVDNIVIINLLLIILIYLVDCKLMVNKLILTEKLLLIIIRQDNTLIIPEGLVAKLVMVF